VLAYEEDSFVPVEVKETLVHTEENSDMEEGYYTMTTENDHDVKVTGNHYMLTKVNGREEYRRVDSLEEGDRIMSSDFGASGWAEIKDLEYLEADLEVVYNLELEEPHNYLAEGMVAHNSKDQPY
ncbi:MAG: Hint domain-containing protein, partial [Nanobdellota archaeon]